MILWFNKGLRELRRCYQKTFLNAEGETVLADLANICPVDPSKEGNITDRLLLGINIGRRQIFEIIKKQCNLTDAEILKMQRNYEDMQERLKREDY